MLNHKWLALVGISLMLVQAMPALAVECTQATVPGPKVLKGKLQISELLPNPSGTEASDEFIELYNGTDATINLDDFTLQDASNKPVQLSGTLASKRYVAFYRTDTNISLNNNGDTVTLLHPGGQTIDTVSYTETVKDDMSFSRIDGSWGWTAATPGAVNKSPEPESTTNPNSGDSDDEATQAYQFSEAVSLSELLPDPEGSDTTDEWIELYNAGDAIDLYGWQLRDSSKTYTVKESLKVNANSYVLFPVTETGISLNNSGETIELVDPNDAEMDNVNYPAAASGQSYSYIDGSWQWATPTPSAANRAPSAPTQPTTPGSPSGPTLTDIKTLSSGTEVTVTGVVTAIPGMYSVNYFYIQDATSGIQVYSSTKNFPALVLGDAVTVHGTLSSTNGEPKINVLEVTVTAQGQTTTPVTVTSLDATQAGKLVSLTGKVTAKASSTLTLDTGLVYVKRGTGISTSTLSEGQSVTVTGVLTSTNDGVQLWPRLQTDLVVATAVAALSDTLVPTAHAADPQQIAAVTPVANTQPNQDLRLLWLGICAAVALLVMRLAKWPWLNTVVRNWVGSTVRAWGVRLRQRVG